MEYLTHTHLRIKRWLLGIVFCVTIPCYGATQSTDTLKIIELSQTAERVFREFPDSAIQLSNQVLDITHQALKQARGKYKLRLLRFKANAMGTLVTVYHDRGDMEKVLPYYDQIFSIQNQLMDRAGMAATLYSIASVHSGQGNIPKAIDYHSRALKIYENLGDKYGAALAFYSLGRIYGDMADTMRQVEYYKKAFEIYTEMKDNWGIALLKTSLGGIYLRRKQFDKALTYYVDCLKMYSKSQMPDGSLGDKWGIANSLECIGRVFDKKNELDSALIYYLRALKIREDTEYKIGMALSYTEIGEVYYKQNKKQEALTYARKALKTSTELGYPLQISKAAKLLSDLEKNNGHFKEALEMFELFYEMADSLRNDENKKASVKQQLSYEYEKREEQLKSEQLKKSAVDEAEKQKQKTVIFIVSLGLLLVLVLAIIIWRNLLSSKEKSRVINMQKALVEDKQKEILDSINYAKRLQQAILATPEEIKSHLPNSFLFYQPKDIVAGDFYFFEVTDTHIFIAAADCTGHGVPGAMVSIVCSNALTRSVKEFKLTQPGEILDKTSELVLETFKKSGTEVRDGMDISLLSIHRQSKTLRWSGANNPLWYSSQTEIKEVAPTKRPVGKSENLLSFMSHSLTLSPDSILYLFTDGYADQFGGPKGKKFKNSNLLALLRESASLPMDKQQQVLADHFEAWKGSLEQIDDVCIIGLKV